MSIPRYFMATMVLAAMLTITCQTAAATDFEDHREAAKAMSKREADLLRAIMRMEKVSTQNECAEPTTDVEREFMCLVMFPCGGFGARLIGFEGFTAHLNALTEQGPLGMVPFPWPERLLVEDEEGNTWGSSIIVGVRHQPVRIRKIVFDLALAECIQAFKDEGRSAME